MFNYGTSTDNPIPFELQDIYRHIDIVIRHLIRIYFYLVIQMHSRYQYETKTKMIEKSLPIFTFSYLLLLSD